MLALPFWRGTQPDYVHYLIKRFCRIYIPFVASIFLALLLFMGTYEQPPVKGVSQWLHGIWPSTPTPSVLAGHILMTGTEKDMELNTVMWSLVYELRISIIFPLLILLVRNTRLAVVAALLLYAGATGILLLSDMADKWLVRTDSFLITFVIMARFVPFFIAGILLSKHRKDIHALIKKLPAWKKHALLLVPLLTFPVPHSSHFADILYGCGAAILIILAVEDIKIQKFLEMRILNWLGHISYSLYLVHLPILMLAFWALIGVLPFGIIVLVVIVASLVASALMNYLIEVPAMALGRKLAKSRKR